jgi:TetR/AcrR family transcriptional repressor of nem operon
MEIEMARPQVFNHKFVISKAIECFWIKGYSETSLSDLLEAMKISRGTFYNSLGDKRQLFELCLRTYSQQTQKIIAMTLQSDKVDSFEAIKQFFYIVLIAPTADMSAKGCFLVNTISETSNVDEELSCMATKLMEPIKLGFIYQLNKLCAEDVSKQHGEWLFTQLLGWRMQCQVGLDKNVLEHQINWSLFALKKELDDGAVNRSS